MERKLFVVSINPARGTALMQAHELPSRLPVLERPTILNSWRGFCLTTPTVEEEGKVE